MNRPTKLHLAPGFDLPPDVVTQKIAILARSGAGKTHTATVLVEEVVKAHLPVVVLDPTGAWFGLRSSIDGKRPGLPVTILGGQHGDRPLSAGAGAGYADFVIDCPGAYVLDLSGFDTKKEELRFAGDFLARLYRAKATRREPLLVVVDEADTFAPQQRDDRDETPTTAALGSIVRRGRIRGLGVVLICQRAAALHKNVLNQTEVLIAMQVTGPQDRTAIDNWIKGNGTAEERATVLDSLASLQRGEAWIWSPSWLRTLKKVQIRQRETYDSSKTPEVGAAAPKLRTLAKVDLAALDERLKATLEQAKANDPNVLKSRLSTLERELAAARAVKPPPAAPAPPPERVEVPVLRDSQIERLGTLVEQLNVRGKSLEIIAGELREAIARADVKHSDQFAKKTRLPDPASAPRPAPVPRKIPAPKPGAGDAGSLGRAERALLAVMAQRIPKSSSRTQIAVLSGYSSGSSTFANALGKLRTLELVEGRGDDNRITEAGLEALGEHDAPPRGRALVTWWLGKLGKAERAMLECLIASYPAALTKEEISGATGYSGNSSTFANALGRLRTLELVEGRGDARASAELFE